MRIVIACLVVFAAACVDEQGYTDRMKLEYQVGEELMNNCKYRNFECWRWLEFKQEWEANVDYLTTFEDSLARYKAATGADISTPKPSKSS